MSRAEIIKRIVCRGFGMAATMLMRGFLMIGTAMAEAMSPRSRSRPAASLLTGCRRVVARRIVMKGASTHIITK